MSEETDGEGEGMCWKVTRLTGLDWNSGSQGLGVPGLEERPLDPLSHWSDYVASAQAHGHRQGSPWWPCDLPFVTPEWISVVHSYLKTTHHSKNHCSNEQHKILLSEKSSYVV